jgi:hypothetical protein
MRQMRPGRTVRLKVQRPALELSSEVEATGGSLVGRSLTPEHTLPWPGLSDVIGELRVNGND